MLRHANHGAIALLACFVFACGSVRFSGGSLPGSKKKSSDSGSGQNSTGSGSSDANGGGSGDGSGDVMRDASWSWPCGSQTTDEEIEATDTMEGGAKFLVAREGLAGLNVGFKGTFCESDPAPRDILFLLDGSLSMNWDDPTIAGSCGRLQAINAVTAKMSQEGDVRFGIAIFAPSFVASSRGFFASRDELYSDILSNTGKSNILDVICSGKLGTDYNDGLAAAQSIINSAARQEADVTIVFVSDGKPLFEQNGQMFSQSLKENGVNILTVAVKGNESVLRDQVASRDQKGYPLHRRIGSVNDLGNTILELTSATTRTATLGFRPFGTGPWNVMKVMGDESLEFNATPVAITIADNPKGIEVFYEYRGPADQGKVKAKGQLTWE